MNIPEETRLEIAQDVQQLLRRNYDIVDAGGVCRALTDHILSWPGVTFGQQSEAAPTETRVTSETGGAKGAKLARFSLMPMDALWALAEHYGLGEQKYPTEGGVPNYRRGYDYTLSIDAQFRHLVAFANGEDVDPEFGDSHLLAVAWHALCIWQNQHDHGDRFDNRAAVKLRQNTTKEN